MLNAEAYTPHDAGAIPTGEIAPVKGTPFDFTTAKPIGRDINSDHQQIKFGMGFDHNFVIKRAEGDKSLQLAARVHEPKSGRVMEVLTTEPGIQFYCGNFSGWPLERQSRQGICQAGWLLLGNATLSRQPQSAQVSVHHFATRSKVRDQHHLQIQYQVNGAGHECSTVTATK